MVLKEWKRSEDTFLNALRCFHANILSALKAMALGNQSSSRAGNLYRQQYAPRCIKAFHSIKFIKSSKGLSGTTLQFCAEKGSAESSSASSLLNRSSLPHPFGLLN